RLACGIALADEQVQREQCEYRELKCERSDELRRHRRRTTGGRAREHECYEQGSIEVVMRVRKERERPPDQARESTPGLYRGSQPQRVETRLKPPEAPQH